MPISENDWIRIIELQKRSKEIIAWIGKLPERDEGSLEHRKILHELDNIDETVRGLKNEPRVPWTNI